MLKTTFNIGLLSLPH